MLYNRNSSRRKAPEPNTLPNLMLELTLPTRKPNASAPIRRRSKREDIRDSSSHGGRAADSTRDSLEEVVGVISSRPLRARKSTVSEKRRERREKERTNLLVSEDVAANLALLGLDESDVGLHSVL